MSSYRPHYRNESSTYRGHQSQDVLVNWHFHLCLKSITWVILGLGIAMSMGKSSITSILLHSVSSCIGVAIGIGISSIESNLEIYIITGKKYEKYKNGNLLPKLFWPTVRKYCSSDRENFWNSRLKAENFQKIFDHLNNLFKQWKVFW